MTEPEVGDERSVLLGWLDFHRGALARKCASLSREQLVALAVPPSRLSLLGLVRHLSEMERAYLRRYIGGEKLPMLYCPDDDPDGDFEGVFEADPAESMAAWRAEIEGADKVVAAALAEGMSDKLRWALLKVTGEYSRHNGHADLLRERIDGVTGE